MCTILLGNLTIADLENDLGIKFNEEDRRYLESTRQEDVSKKLANDAWHFFDIPRRLVLGSPKAHRKFKDLLKKYEPAGSVQIEIILDKDSEPKSFYQMTTESGYPRFLFSVSKYLPIDAYNSYSYYQLVKENKKTLVYRRIRSKKFESEVLEIDAFILHETLVPAEDDFGYDEIKISKDVFDLTNDDEVVLAGYEPYSKTDVRYLTRWNGERHLDKIHKDPSSKFFKIIEEHKLRIRELRKRNK